MAQRFVNVPWDQQPQEAVGVDPDHPLGRALDAAWIGNDLSGVDVLKGHRVALLSATTIGRTTRGNAFTHTGTAGTAVAVPGEAALPYVQIGYGYFVNAGGAWVQSQLSAAAGGYLSRLALASSTTVTADVRWNFGTQRTLTITLPTTIATPICMALVAYSSSDYRFFANGQQQNGTLNPGTFVSLDRMLPPGDTLNGGLWLTGFGSGAAVSDEDMLRITANPEVELWSMFRRRIWVPVNAAPPDTTAPILSSPTGSGGTLDCSGTVSTDEANGNLYAVATASATAPTGLQVENGQDHTGAAALRVVGPQTVTATGVQTVGSGSVTAGTRYLHYMHKDAAGNRSAVVSSASFVVSAGGGGSAIAVKAFRIIHG